MRGEADSDVGGEGGGIKSVTYGHDEVVNLPTYDGVRVTHLE